jgi:hypothetical protein
VLHLHPEPHPVLVSLRLPALLPQRLLCLRPQQHLFPARKQRPFRPTFPQPQQPPFLLLQRYPALRQTPLSSAPLFPQTARPPVLHCHLQTGRWKLAAGRRADLYEAKSFDGDALLVVATTLFGTNVTS